jgi:uncharacterized phiE125 gp8 family phage protein
MTFIQPPFWAQGSFRPRAPHAVSIVVAPPGVEPLTLDQAKLRAGLDWIAGDPRDALMTDFIKAARSKVEKDTGLALLEQTRDVYLDGFPGYGYDPIRLPPQSRPLQEVLSVSTIDTAGATNVLAGANYVVDLVSGRIGLAYGAAWPTDLRPFQPVVIRIRSGYADVAALSADAPLLIHAVGLLVAHYATAGRDLATTGTIITETPHGYDEAIADYLPIEVV